MDWMLLMQSSGVEILTIASTAPGISPNLYASFISLFALKKCQENPLSYFSFKNRGICLLYFPKLKQVYLKLDQVICQLTYLFRLQLLASGNAGYLLGLDQLKKSQKQGLAFADFSEGPITFPPTFKVSGFFFFSCSLSQFLPICYRLLLRVSHDDYCIIIKNILLLL